MKQLSSAHLATVEEADDAKANITEVNKSYIDVVKGCSDNLETAVGKFCDEVFPREEALTKLVLIDLADRIKPGVKLARIGLAVRVLLSIVLTYTDEVTDAIVLKKYGEGGEETRKYFHISIAILATPTLINILMAWIANKKKGSMAIGKGVIFAVMQLNPIVHGLNFWSGVEVNEDDTVHPFMLFICVRMSELIFEVMPETILQLYVINHTEDISRLAIFSILSSVVSAAYIMTDNSMMYERNNMVRKKEETRRRTQTSSPLCFHTEPSEARTLHRHLCWFYPP